MDMESRKRGVFSELETQSPEQRQARKWPAMQHLVQTAWSGSQEFQGRLEKAGLTPEDVASLDDWPAIPVIHKKEIIALQQERGLGSMLSCEVGDLSRIYMSPGPIFDPESRSHDYWGWTEAFFAAGFRPRDVVQMTFSYHLTPAGLMLEEPLREIGCAVVPAGPGNTDTQIELLTRLPVTGFVGMASYLKVIKDKAAKSGLDPKKDFRLQAAFVAAERLPESLRSELEDELSMLIRQGYGTADVGCAAYECPQLTGMHISSRCWVEICDPKTGQPLPVGETGEVVITPFTTAYPLVRLGTGDLSYLVDDPCSCGRTSARLGSIVGRVDDTAKVKGQFIYPHQAKEVAAKFPSIQRWQIVVSNPGGKDAIAVKLLARGEADVDGFVKAFQTGLKLRPQVIMVDTDSELPEGAPALVDERTFD